MGKLPYWLFEILDALLKELREDGPERHNWPHYGRIQGKGDVDMRHCHLNKGRPTYVAVWVVEDKRLRLLEVKYVGTHENANYRKIN